MVKSVCYEDRNVVLVFFYEDDKLEGSPRSNGQGGH